MKKGVILSSKLPYYCVGVWKYLATNKCTKIHAPDVNLGFLILVAVKFSRLYTKEQERQLKYVVYSVSVLWHVFGFRFDAAKIQNYSDIARKRNLR